MATTSTPTRPVVPVRPEFAGIVRDEERFATDDADDFGNRLNGWFDELMVQSGTGLGPSLAVVLCAFSALAFGGALFVLQEDPLSAAIAGMFGFMLPVGVLMLIRSNRQNKILKQMPEMVDEMARAARTGRSLESCLEIVARDTPSPLGDELEDCSRRVRLGLPMSRALLDLPRRTGVNYLSVFTMALTLHHESGGDLVHVLERLAQTVRDRITYLGRLKVATIASRATAVLMLVLPPAILAFFVFRDSQYLTQLMESGWARTATMVAAILQFVGSLWVLQILRSSQRN